LLHLLAIILVQQPTPLIGAQNAASHVHLHRLGVVRIQRWCLGEAHAALRIELEYAVDDDHMKVDVAVQGRPESVDEGDCPGSYLRPRPAATAQAVLDGVEVRRKALLRAFGSCSR